MRNLPKFVGFIAIIAIICLFFSVCDETSGLNNGDNGGKTPTPGLLFTLINGPAYSVSLGEADAVHIVIPAKHNDLPVTTIKQEGFRYSAILSVSIPNSITTIGWSAFYGCIGLTSITIPNSVTSIDSSAFSGCTGLTSITVHENNPNYSSQNGILYNKEKTSLIFAPQGLSGSITIPNGVTSIGDYAFSGWTSSQTIHIPFATLEEADETWFYYYNQGWRLGCYAVIKNNAGVQVWPLIWE